MDLLCVFLICACHWPSGEQAAAVQCSRGCCDGAVTVLWQCSSATLLSGGWLLAARACVVWEGTVAGCSSEAQGWLCCSGRQSGCFRRSRRMDSLSCQFRTAWMSFMQSLFNRLEQNQASCWVLHCIESSGFLYSCESSRLSWWGTDCHLSQKLLLAEVSVHRLVQVFRGNTLSEEEVWPFCMVPCVPALWSVRGRVWAGSLAVHFSIT